MPIVFGCAEDHEPEATSVADGTDGSTGERGDTANTDDTTAGELDTTGGSTSDPGSDESSGGEPIPIVEAEQRWRVEGPYGSATAVCVRPDGSVMLATSRTNGDYDRRSDLAAFTADGDALWTTAIDEPPAGTYFHAVACAPDGAVYAVGQRGEYDSESIPLLIRVEFEGTTSWTVTLPGVTQAGFFGGAIADAEGVFVVGARDAAPEDFGHSPLLARYEQDGTESWMANDRLGGDDGAFHDVVRVGDVLMAVGNTSGEDYDEHAVVASFEQGGAYRWHTEIAEGWSVALHVAVDPSSDAAFVAGTYGRSFSQTDAWSMRCDVDGCIDPELFAEFDVSFGTFDGFAIDALGRRIGANRGRTEARARDGAVAWTFDAEAQFVWTQLRSTVAIDPSGTIYTAVGQDPAVLIALTPPQ
ncbi:MAG: PQQ-like beta-propeller repeat protein [Deltaproteobacteria bacterium]|nr:PQQ-like beta-propeller repeat protein [Nannocystaceae bacterium]